MKLTPTKHKLRNWEWEGIGCNEDALDEDVKQNGVDGSKMADYVRTPDGKRVADYVRTPDGKRKTEVKEYIKWYDAIRPTLF